MVFLALFKKKENLYKTTLNLISCEGVKNDTMSSFNAPPWPNIFLIFLFKCI